MTTSRRAFTGLLLATCLLPAPAMAADNWPDKPIRLIIPFPAGGGFDTVARRLAEGLREQLKTSVLVDNRPGANTEIATVTAARAQPDGYTFLMNAPAGIVQGPWLNKNLPYDPLKDLLPVYMVAQVPTALIVPATLGVSNFAQFVEYAKNNRGKSAYASLGNGSTFHIFGAMLNSRLNAGATHVPYKGDAPAMNDLVPGRVQFMFNNPVSAIGFARQDKVRILAVSGKDRLKAISDVPTMGELGMPEFNIVGWYGLFAPAGTPRSIADKLADATRRVMNEPAMQTYLESVGVMTADSGVDAFSRQVKEEHKTWGELISKHNIQVD